MAFVKIIEETEADGALRRLYESAQGRAGYVANIIKVMSADQLVAEASMQFYIRLMRSEKALSRARKEMLAAVVSNINDCYY